MLSLFCLRLALGLLAALFLLTPAQINPRFFRVHFLTVLGLTAAAAALGWAAGSWLLLVILAFTMALAFAGSLVWSLEGTPGGGLLIVLTLLVLGSALTLPIVDQHEERARVDASRYTRAPVWLFVDDVTAALVLGMATTAMLMGHSYLIAPSTSLTPLRRLLIGTFAAILCRMAVVATGLGFWISAQSAIRPTDLTILWLPVRWGLGFVLPLILTGMAWQTMRLRNTQSATGILYIVVVFCFLGELTSLLLVRVTGYLL